MMMGTIGMKRSTLAWILCTVAAGCELGGGSSNVAPDTCRRDGGTFYVGGAGAGDSSCAPGSIEDALKSGKLTLEVTADVELKGTVELPDGGALQGPKSGKAPTIRCPADQDCVRLKGEGTVARVTLTGGGGHGVVGGTNAVKVIDARIEKMKGDGVHFEGKSAILVQSSAIVGNLGRGIYAKGIGGIAVIDPVYAPKPFSKDSPIGVIDPVYSPKSEISGNGQGGIAVIDPVYAPKSDIAAEPVVITSTLIKDNGRYGIGLWSAPLQLVNSAVVGTVAGKSGPWADGVLVAKGAQAGKVAILVQDGALIASNGRTGLLVTHDAAVTVAGQVSSNGLGGIWAHGGGTKVTLPKTALVHGNKAVGVVVTKGADLDVSDAEISKSKLHEVAKGTEMGDGVGVYNGARATLRNAKLLNNERAAIVVHAAKQNSQGEADVVVEGCEMKGGAYSFVINGAPVPLAAAADKNDAESAGQAGGSSSSGSGSSSGGSGSKHNGYADNASLPVQTGYCDGKDPDESGSCTADP